MDPAAGLTVAQLKTRLTTLGVSFHAHELKGALQQRLRSALAENTPAPARPPAATRASSAVRRRRTTRAMAAEEQAAQEEEDEPPAASSSSAVAPVPVRGRGRPRLQPMQLSVIAAAADQEEKAPSPPVGGRRLRRRSAAPAAAAAPPVPAAPRTRARVSRGTRAPRAPVFRRVASRAPLPAHMQISRHQFVPNFQLPYFSSDSSSSSEDEGGDYHHGLPVRSESEESDEESYWNPSQASAIMQSAQARLQASLHTAMSNIAASAGSAESRRMREEQHELISALIADRSHHLASALRQFNAVRSQPHAPGGGLRFKRDVRRIIMSRSEVPPPVAPLSMPQLVELVTSCVKQHNTIDLSQPVGASSWRARSLPRPSTDTTAAAYVGLSAISASLGNSIARFDEMRQRRLMQAAGGSGGRSSFSDILQESEDVAEIAAAAAAAATEAVTTATAAAEAVAAATTTSRPRFGSSSILGPPLRVPMQQRDRPVSPTPYSFPAAAAAASSSAAVPAWSAPAQSSLVVGAPDELRLVASLFARPDVLGACFHGAVPNAADMDTSAPASSAAAAMHPVVRVGLLPFDLVALRLQFAKLCAPSSPELSSQMNALLVSQLRTLFRILWAFVLDQASAEEWLSFPVTYPKLLLDTTPPPVAGTPMPAADLVASIADGSGSRKRVRFSGREVAASSAAASTAIMPPPPIVEPLLTSALNELYMEQIRAAAHDAWNPRGPAAPNRSLAQAYFGAMNRPAPVQLPHAHHALLGQGHGGMTPSYRRDEQSSLSSVASPSSTGIHPLGMPFSSVQHSMLPPAHPAAASATTRAHSEVVDLTLSDAEDDEAVPLPSSASTSFTQAPRLTLSSLVAQQQQHDELRHQAQNQRQLQSPSASSIRSMDAFIADAQPILDRTAERRVLYCPNCSRVNAYSEARHSACIQCGTLLHSQHGASLHARQGSDLVPMDVDQPAAAVTGVSSSSVAGGPLIPRPPASVTSELESLAPLVKQESGVVAPISVANLLMADVVMGSVSPSHSPSVQEDSPFAPIVTSSSAVVAAAASSSSAAVAIMPRTPLPTLITHSFFILLQLPQLNDPTSPLCRELWVCLAAQSPEIADEFVEFASSLPPAAARSELTRWIACVQACITSRLVAHRKLDTFLRGCVRSLALFHRVNEALRLRYPDTASLTNGPESVGAAVSPVLERSVFLNESITSLDSLSADYRNYLAGLEEAASAARVDAHLDSLLRARVDLSGRIDVSSEPPRKRMRSEDPSSNHVAIVTAPAAADSQHYPQQPKNPNATPVLRTRQFAFTSFPFLLDASSFSRILLSESQREQQDLMNAEHELHHQHHAILGRQGLLHRHHHAHMNPNYGALVLSIRREYLVADTLHQLQRLNHSSELKRPLKIVFADEEGIDAGGVKREFFSLLVRQLFSPDFNMFTSESEQYWFNPTSLYSPDGGETSSASMASLNAEALSALGEYELVGIVLGLSIYNGVQLEVRFPSIVYKKLLAKSRVPDAAGASASLNHKGDAAMEYSLSDLATSHPELARGLQQLLAYPAATSAELVETFGLEFTVDHAVFGATTTRELVPGGAGLSVTLENRAAYVAAYTRYILHDSIALQFDAFARGFFKVVSKRPLELLTHPTDLELLICGNQAPNFDELEAAASYEGWSHYRDGRPAAPVIAHFWAFFHALPDDLKLKLLAFVTGSNRIPIKGLKHIKFVLLYGGDDGEKLPESHTCFHQLVLPSYKDSGTLRGKFLQALAEGGEGFQLK